MEIKVTKKQTDLSKNCNAVSQIVALFLLKKNPQIILETKHHSETGKAAFESSCQDAPTPCLAF